MRILQGALCLCVGLWLTGCGDDERAEPPEDGDAGASADAGVGAALVSVVSDVIHAADQSLVDNCPCYVSMGAYPSVEECIMWQHSREDWIPCLTPVLEKHQSRAAVEAFRCMRELLEETTTCLAGKACDPVERAECGRSPLECLSGQTDLAIQLGTACPDISLLSRLQ